MALARRIAVIGAGISGLATTLKLDQAGYHVTLYEKENRLGGHAHTVEVKAPDGSAVAVDTGFIVYNEPTYPNLTRLFAELNVPTRVSDMSFAASLDGGRLEYGSRTLGELLGQRRNILRPRFWRMVMGILRFYKEAPQVLHAPEVWEGMTLGDYLELERYSRPFVEDHLLPMAAAIWSSPATDIRAFPLEMFLRFFQNHGLLQRHNRPQWRTVEGGSRAYIERLRAAFSPRVTVLKDTPTVRVWRQPGQVGVKDSKDNTIFYEQVVLACHADEAFSMLQDADAQERSILSVFPYTPNEAVLHSDTRLMPRNRRVWSSWNYRRTGRNNPNVDVTYWMNRLQGQPDSLPLFVSLNPDPAPDPSLVHGRWTYHHPAYNRKSLRTQKQLHRIQGKRNTWFCGAWCGYGFHEDGLSSALAVVEGIQATGMEKQAA